MSLTVGIDVGTSACRACAIDQAGTLICGTHEPLPPGDRRDLNHQQLPADWWRALCCCLESLFQSVEPRQVNALAVAATSASVVLTAKDGEPLSAALMYDDCSSIDEAELIADIAPKTSMARGPSSGLAKIMQLAGHAHTLGVVHACTQASWLTGQLCGTYDRCDEHNALKLGFDPVNRQWPVWLDQLLGIHATSLPETVLPGTVIGPVLPKLAQQFGLPGNCMVVAGTTDSTAAVMASGACAPGKAVTVLGSTLVLKVVSDYPVFEPRYGVYSHRLGSHWLVGGASNTGGAVLARYFSTDELERFSACINPDQPTGLDYYPLLKKGERFPVSDPQFPPRLSPRPDDPVAFLHGLLEGIANIELKGYRLLESLGVHTPRCVISMGGGAGNEVFRIIRQRKLHIPVSKAQHQDAAYGAACLARQGFNSTVTETG